MSRASRRHVFLASCLVLAACGSSGGKVTLFDVPAVPDGGDPGRLDAPDAAAMDVLAAEVADAAAGDGLADGTAGDAGDPGDPDAVADVPVADAKDVPGDTGPFVPFAGCDAKNPCRDALQDLCLLLPGKQSGVCVQTCGKDGDAACPPSQECVYIDAANSACFELARWGEPCTRTGGVLCDASRMEYCLGPEGPSDPGTCTTYCNPELPSCAAWQACTALPGTDAFACLARTPGAACADGGCAEGQVCRDGRCLPGCDATPCDKGLSCVEAGGTKACVPPAASVGNECMPGIGLACAEGLECLPAQGTWMGYCAAACAVQADCPPFTFCRGGRCLRADRLVADAAPCSAILPCADPSRSCVNVSEGVDLCLEPCTSFACPAGGACEGGFCVQRAGPGEPCSPELGLPCAAGWTCRVDESLDHHFGFCTHACTGTDCTVDGAPVPGLACAGGECARSVGYGGECSDVAGIRCGPGEGLSCMVLNGGLRSGLCTQECTLGGACPDPFEGADAQCLFSDGAKHYCALMCQLGDCPDFLSCRSPGVCLY